MYRAPMFCIKERNVCVIQYPHGSDTNSGNIRHSYSLLGSGDYICRRLAVADRHVHRRQLLSL